ncbi:MAG: tetratricopeptide repeat protein [Candidatus Omnitrophota bacterium]
MPKHLKLFNVVLMVVCAFLFTVNCYSQTDEEYQIQGNQFEQNGKYEEAISAYTKAIQINPYNGYDYLIRASLYFKMKEYDKVISDYTEAIKLNPKNQDLYFERGLIYDMQHKTDAGITDWIKSIEIDPVKSAAYLSLVGAYRKKKDYEHALLYINKAIKVHPENFVNYGLCGWVYSDKGEFDNAIMNFNKALEAINHDLLSDDLEKKKAFMSLQEYKDVLKKNEALIYLHRAKAFFGKKDFEKSWSDVHQAESLGGQMVFKDDSKFLEDLKKASGRDM